MRLDTVTIITVRESALKNWLLEKKIPCRTGESNLRQRRDGPTLHQLSYIPNPNQGEKRERQADRQANRSGDCGGPNTVCQCSARIACGDSKTIDNAAPALTTSDCLCVSLSVSVSVCLSSFLF